MPKQIQYLYKTKSVLDLCNQDNIVELYQIISDENFLENIQLLVDGEVHLLSESTLDQIKIFESALIEAAVKNNLNPFFRAYIRNIFELQEVKRAIEKKTQSSDSYPEEKQKLNDKCDRIAARLEMLKKSNESSIKEIEKNRAELKAEKNKYELFQFAVLVFTILPIVPLGFISSIATLIAVPALLAVALLEIKFFEPWNSFYTEKLEELYSKHSSLKEPITNLEMDFKSYKRRIVSFEQLNSDTQQQLQKLKEQQIKLENKIANFNPEQLAPLNLKGTLSKSSMFKAEDSTVSLVNPEAKEPLSQSPIL
ncbi:hypothetical protein [Legionella saoudiensis]|uniref:hypothetical protein n=1 Tax=Legionella saoudiensis TaxID=1750561 RepID=UPI0007309268|nr:hypothetical protein [Legionella saoudiensis]